MTPARAFLRKHPPPRALLGHPWVFAGEIARWEGEPVTTDAVHVHDARGRFIGSALFSPQSSIRLRVFSRKREEWNHETLEKLLLAAIARRGEVPADTARRLVWSEADALPGLVVDSYGKNAVSFQIQHATMETMRGEIITLIKRHLTPGVLVERSDAAGRKMEGLAPRAEIIAGDSPVVTCRVGRALFQVDLLRGQKSGAFLDQAHNYQLIAEHCAGKSVLDCFCHHGGFGIHAALAGAARVEGVDISAEACEAMLAAAALNGVSVTTRAANVFDDLRAREKSGERWDVIILDPPSFTRSRESVAGAMRGYHEINLRAMKMLPPGGLLATFTCSHHIQPEDYLHMLRSAASDARRDLVIVAEFSQPPDHPVLLSMPESRYLRGWLLEAR